MRPAPPGELGSDKDSVGPASHRKAVLSSCNSLRPFGTRLSGLLRNASQYRNSENFEDFRWSAQRRIEIFGKKSRPRTYKTRQNYATEYDQRRTNQRKNRKHRRNSN